MEKIEKQKQIKQQIESIREKIKEYEKVKTEEDIKEEYREIKEYADKYKEKWREEDIWEMAIDVTGQIITEKNRKLYIKTEDSYEYKKQLLERYDIDNILETMGKTIKDKQIKINQYDDEWLRTLGYYDKETETTVEIPEEIVKYITREAIRKKIENTKDNEKINRYKRNRKVEEKIRSILKMKITILYVKGQ